jgi:hypothetical protein
VSGVGHGKNLAVEKPHGGVQFGTKVASIKALPSALVPDRADCKNLRSGRIRGEFENVDVVQSGIDPSGAAVFLLTATQAESVADAVVKRRFKRGEVIVEQGEKSNTLFIILTAGCGSSPPTSAAAR